MTDNRTTELRKALDFMRIWISNDAHLGESEFSYELEKAEGLRKLEAIEQAIAATLGNTEIVRCRDCRYNAKDTDGICYRFDHEHFNQPDCYCAWGEPKKGGEAR